MVITFVDISLTKALETTMREAQTILQTRFTEQAEKLDTARKLEGVLQKAQAVLEKRLNDQTADLRQSRADLVTEKGRKGK